jgi:hypothetical protein
MACYMFPIHIHSYITCWTTKICRAIFLQRKAHVVDINLAIKVHIASHDISHTVQSRLCRLCRVTPKIPSICGKTREVAASSNAATWASIRDCCVRDGGRKCKVTTSKGWNSAEYFEVEVNQTNVLLQSSRCSQVRSNVCQIEIEVRM